MTAGARETAVSRFLARHGWTGAEIVSLAGDASFRSYFRVLGQSRTAVLMDAPPALEPIEPFVEIARHLRSLGFSAPEVLASNAADGLMLLEDLGDGVFSRLLDRGVAEAGLYRQALDTLIALHRTPRPLAVPCGLPRYDDALLAAEASLLIDWYAPAVLGGPVGAAQRDGYLAAWRTVFAHARGVPETLVLRDYHVDNLVRLEGREGIAACGLLDFQDAVSGPVSYDVVSLLQDARRDVPQALATEMRARYLAAFPALNPEAFDMSCAVLGAQRHCKVLGIFARLDRRDRKPCYLRHIPRVWRLLERSIAHPVLAPVADWIARWLPGPSRIVPEPDPAA